MMCSGLGKSFFVCKELLLASVASVGYSCHREAKGEI